MRHCRICGEYSPAISSNRVINGFALFECQNCWSILTEEKPEKTALKIQYDYLFRQGEYEQHRIEHEKLCSGIMPQNYFRSYVLKKLEKNTGRKIVEIGGGTGSFGVLARSRGWEYTDYDISNESVNCCRKLGLDAHCFNIDNTPPLSTSSVDVVVMWEVIEHVWNLGEYLEVIGNALKEGGVFVFSTPNYFAPILKDSDEWGVLSSPPIHVNFFTNRSIIEVLSAHFGKVNIFRRRFYKPDCNIKSFYYYFKSLICNETETLYGFAYK